MRAMAQLAVLFVLAFSLIGIVPAAAQTTGTGTATEATAPAQDDAAGGAPTSGSKSILAGRKDAVAQRRGDGLYDRAMLWIEARQRELNKALTGSVRELKAQGSIWAGLVLAGIGFLYGVLHAAGPGHGKAIVSSYVLADGRTLRRGVAVAFMAGFIQALSAILIVSVLAIVLGSTGRAIEGASNRLEQVSYALIALLGAWLLWRAVADAFRPSTAAAHAHHHHDHHDHHHGHKEGEACAHCGHVHLPGPDQLAGNWSWKRAIALAAAVGVRPCTGAIIVLVFALSQGIFWAGVWATFAMALGTAITVSVLAAMTVGARGLAIRMTGGNGVWAQRLETAAGIGGASLVLLLGAAFFLASLGPTRPFGGG